jgi:hypothetical protein
MDYYCKDCLESTSGTCWRHSAGFYIDNTTVVYGPVPFTERKPHKCPVCQGTGIVSRPPWIAGDIGEWTDSGNNTYPCKACDGKGVIWG